MNDVGVVYFRYPRQGGYEWFSPRERDKLCNGAPHVTEDIM
jgi:hypothetical protein